MKKLNKIGLAIAGMLFVSVSQASGPIVITADTDNTGDGGVFLRSEGGSFPSSFINLNDDGGSLDIGSSTINLGAPVTNINSPTTNINGNTAISGTFSSAGNASLNGGTTTINSNGGAAEITVTNGNITTIGTFNQTGATSITGTLTNTGNATLGTAANTVNAMGNAGTSTNTLLGNINNLTATGANSANNISAGVNSMTATTRNDINAPVNNMGVGTVSQNTIGNNLAATTVTSRAGNATQALSNGFANTTVVTALPTASGLANAVVAPSSQVLLSNAGGTTVDANGKIVRSVDADYVAPTSPTAALTVTNGYGNTHGLVVTESQTTLSGGTQSSSLTLSDRAATFSNAQTGAPITVTGVADGKADFDAVNVRQFAGAIAGVTAMASIPAPQPGQTTSVGVGVGHFMSKSALAFGFNHKVSANTLIKGSVASGLNGGAKPMVGFGASWGF